MSSGVWVFKSGVVRVAENDESGPGKRKALLHVPSGEVVSSYASLERMLAELGWERYEGGDDTSLQYHKRGVIDLISVPKDFARFQSTHMYDIVIKNRDAFRVIDA